MKNRKIASMHKLVPIVERHISQLRSVDLGNRFRIGDCTFHLLQNDRNVLYKVKANQLWFLKIPRSKTAEEVIIRESIGLKCAGVIANQSVYYTVPNAKYSISAGYLLTSEIKGIQLQRAFYRSCLPSGGKGSILKWYNAFGSCLALMHNSNHKNELKKCNRTTSVLRLRQLCNNIQAKENLSEEITRWAYLADYEKGSTKFVHGNIKPENILLSDKGVAIIDFENCGQGSVYDDLSFFCLNLILTKTLIFFPWRKALRAFRHFLEGYQTIGELRVGLLKTAITARLADYYLSKYVLHKEIPLVAGIPVQKSKLQHLLTSLLRSHSDNQDPGTFFI